MLKIKKYKLKEFLNNRKSLGILKKRGKDRK